MQPKYSAKQRIELIKRALEGESVSSICGKYQISRTIFYRWLNRYRRYGENGLSFKIGGRPRKSQTPKKIVFRKLSSLERFRMVEAALAKEKDISSLAKEYEVSRNTIYKWIKRYQLAPDKRIMAVSDQIPQVKRYFRQAPQLYEEAVKSLVSKYPKYGVRKIVQNLPKVGVHPILSHHGVQNILRRSDLSTFEKRFLFAQGQITPQIRTIAAVLGRVGQFFALSHETRKKVIRILTAFSLSFGATIFLTGFFGYVVTTAEKAGMGSAGLFFATVALLIGSVFFLYSLKYYLTLALVLSFSQEGKGEGEIGIEARGKSLLTWLLGLGGRKANDKKQANLTKAGGLEANLEHVRLTRHPFISIHIPLYNEKNVVERLINASTSFDYEGEYEVILCDDSTDGTSKIISDYLGKFQIPNSKFRGGEGWTLSSVEVAPGVIVKHLHRTSRSGFKGGALREALIHTDPRAEFVSVFDADFVPYPDTLTLFLKYFQVTAGSLDFAKSKQSSVNSKPNKTANDELQITDHGQRIAAVQGYQWHVLNKSENWITRGVRSEYAGSYVIERSGTEIYSGLKQISGSVYMIRRDVLEEVGWETSITEDFELTLKLYEAGYKVVYTPYIQAPAECVSTIKRLVRQRMRWAEGHSNNIKRMFVRLMFGHWEDSTVEGRGLNVGVEGRSLKVESQSSNLNPQPLSSTPHPPSSKSWIPSPLSFSEKLEFLYLSPYYLQAFFFLVGTLSWLVSETVFRAHLPFWTELWGWSLVLTNLLALPLMNAVGLFLEESEEKDYAGLASFVALSYILVPFQAYASLKGFLEKSEGPWFRTPKTGRITDIFTRGRFYRFISGILPGRAPALQTLGARHWGLGFSLKPNANTPALPAGRLNPNSLNPYLSLATANSRFDNFRILPRNKRKLGNFALSLLLSLSSILAAISPFIPVSNLAYASEPNLRTAQDLLSASHSDEVTEAKNPSNKETILKNASTRQIDTPRAIVKTAKSGKQIEFIFHKEPRVRIKADGREVEFETLSIGGKKAFPSESKIYSNKEVVYEEVIEGVDLKYSIAGNVLIEEFILKDSSSLSSSASIIQSVKTTDVKIVSPNSEAFGFYSKEGEELFKFSQPFAKDAMGEVSYDIDFSLEKDKIGYRLIKSFGQNFGSWLSAKERVFPISIDPSVIVSGGIEEGEVQYGGLQRKVAYVNGNWYAFYNCDAVTCTASTGGRIFFKKSSDGLSWDPAVTVDDGDTDNYNPSIAVSNNIIHVWWIDDGADRSEGRRIDTASSDAQGTLCQTSIEAGAIGNTFMTSVAQFSDTSVLIAYSDTTGGDAEINAFEIAGLDGSCSGNTTSVVTGNVTFGTQGAGLTSGDRPVLVGLDATSAAVVFQDGTDLSFAKYDASRDEWRRNNQTIGSVTDTIYSVTTDGTNIWALSVDTSTNQNTRLYSCCTADIAEFLIDSDTGSSGDEQDTEMDIWCPTSDPANCKVVYVDNLETAGPDLVFVDCDDENCSTFGSGTPRVIDSDTGSATNAPSPALFCVTSNNCKIAHGDLLGGNSPDVSLIDCNDETCSAPSQGDINGDLGGSTSKPNTSLYCMGDTDCKVVFFEDDTDDLWFADCSNANCSTRDALTAISLNINTTNSNAKNSIWCPAADDCKILYHDAVEGDLTLIDCTASTTCASRTELDIDTDVGGTSVNVPNAIDCTPGATDCKLIYADGSQLEFNFVDCGDATCTSANYTITKIDDTAGGLTTFGVDLDCSNGANDCKGVYVGNTASPEDQYFFDCDSAACASGSVIDLENPPTRSALACPSSTNCKLVYYDALESSQPPVYFADCDTADCLPTWTDEPDPWTSQTNITSATITYDSSNSDLYASVIKDTNEKAYLKSTDATTIFWGSESDWGWSGSADHLGQISGPLSGAGSSQIGVVLREGTNFEFAVVPEKTLILLLALPVISKYLSFLNKKKKKGG